MTDYPIIFSSIMVRALLDGRKTMTRRLAWKYGVTPPAGPEGAATPWQRMNPGDRLWLRESFKPYFRRTPTNPGCIYRADCNEFTGNKLIHQIGADEVKWTPSIHMPRWASRLTLTVTATKVERLNGISAQDAIAEGVEGWTDNGKQFWKRYRDGGWNTYVDDPIGSFASLWTELHGAGSWEADPEVVALTFTVAKQNIDQVKA